MLTSATAAEFDTFLTTYGHTVASSSAPLLALSFAFMNTIPWCDDADLTDPIIQQAQMFLAYAMSAEGGGFNPQTQTGNIYTTKEKVGPLEQEYKLDTTSASGKDVMGLLKTFPIIYGMLQPFICEPVELAAGDHVASVFVV